jgi:hypothetical protein
VALAFSLVTVGSPSARGEDPRIPSVWRSCSEHFLPRAAPRIDVLRLGLACGPVSGLTRWARVSGVVEENASPVVLRWKAERRDCFRLFAVAGSPVDDLEVEITGPPGTPTTLTNQSRRWALVGEQGPFCAAQAGDFEARFSTHAGRGALSAAVWRGARMQGPGMPWSGSGSDGSDSVNPY